MKSVAGRRFIVAVVMSAALFMSSGVEAAGLFAPGGDSTSRERQIGLFEQAMQWLSGAWGDLTSVFSASEEPTPPPSGTECTENCGDAGPGIDPIG